MNSLQLSTLNMYSTVDTYLKANSAIVDPLPNYPTCYTVFSGGLGQIKVLSEEQQFKSLGLIRNKNELKQKLAVIAFDVAKKIKAYARFTNNNVLYDEVDFSESDLKYANDEELREYAKGIYNRAQDNLAELEPYGITADTQTDFLNVLTEYTTAVSKIKMSRVLGKQQTMLLAKIFKDTDAALDDIDAIVEIIKLKEPKFYNGYKLARKIIFQGTGSLALKGLVLDAETKEPIKNATITLKLKSNGDATLNGNDVIHKKSALKGGFRIKSLPGGIYDVSISKNGYVEQKTTLAVTNGELSKLEVALEADNIK